MSRTLPDHARYQNKDTKHAKHQGQTQAGLNSEMLTGVIAGTVQHMAHTENTKTDTQVPA